jgi:hypothetical protein
VDNVFYFKENKPWTYKRNVNPKHAIHYWYSDALVKGNDVNTWTWKGVAIDATFGTNENKVHPLNFMSILVELDYLLFKFNVPRCVIVQLWNIRIEFGLIM